MQHHLSTARTLRVALLLFAAACGTSRAGDAPPVRDIGSHWMETRLGGVPTGFLRETVDVADGGGTRTEVEAKFVMNRMESRVEVRSLVRYVEDAEGLLLQADAEVGSSAEATRVQATVVDGSLRLRSGAGGSTYDTTTALAEPLLGPQGIRARSRALREPGDRIAFHTFAGEYGSLAKVVREATGRETVPDADGRDVQAVVVRETLDVMPVPSLLWLDAEGRTLRIRQESPFGRIESVASDAGVPQRVAGGAELPMDTYANAVAKSNIRLPQPRSLDRVQVRIDLRRDDTAMPTLDGPHQRVIEHGPRHAVVEMQRGSVPAGRGDVDGAPWLVPNAYLQSDHPQVRELAATLRRPGLDAYTQARVLQDWVATNMRFDAGIALVSASEAVRDRRGTCMAYAVVLTTLARALDIPSRVVMGYIYAANMWGGHAWTEVLVDGHWVALDAAVWRDGPADPARIGVVRTALDQGMASGLASLAPMFGNERVRVLDYTLDGVDTVVPESAAPYTVDGRDYRNPSLGLRVQAPEGFVFAEVDIMYPRNEVLVLRDDAGTRIDLEQRAVHPGESADPAMLLRERGFEAAVEEGIVAGRLAWLARAGDKAAAVWLDGSDAWTVEVEGQRAADVLRAALAGIAFDTAER